MHHFDDNIWRMRKAKKNRLELATVKKTGQLVLVQKSARKENSYDEWQSGGNKKQRKYMSNDLKFLTHLRNKTE